MKPFVFVALDYNTQSENLDFAKKLSIVDSDRFGYKVNLDSVVSFSSSDLTSYQILLELKKLGKPIFVDMKMWNGGRTMSNVAKGCADCGVDIVNMYPHAGGKFVRRVRSSLDGSSTKLFTLTVLTHYTDKDTQRLYGKNLSDAVRMLAEIGYESGADGLIVPATQLDVVYDIPLPKLCPGIRPDWYKDKKDNSQEQVMTPSGAISRRANIIVVGGPVRKSKNQVEALERILEEIS